MRRIHFILLTVILAATSLAALPLQAETFREKLRARMEERAASKAESTQQAQTAAAIAGTQEFTVGTGRSARPYLVHLPRGYDPAVAAPLVFAFHGGGGNMTYMANDAIYGLQSAADKYGFIVAFPNGYSRVGGKLATWNAGKCCGAARDTGSDDIGYVRLILADLEKRYNVDKARVFATGMSNGGMISYRIACEMAGTFKAIAAVAGTDNTTSCNPAQPISIMHIHAQNDDHVLFNGGMGPGAQRPDAVTEFRSVPDTIQGWVVKNRCNATPQRVLQKPGAYCDIYTGCLNNTQVKLCVTEDGAHSWPGGGESRGKATSKALVANDEIWNFFSTR